MTVDPRKPVVFVSYSHDVESVVAHLSERLSGNPNSSNPHGYLLWWDKGLARGDRYEAVLEGWIGRAALVVVVLSPDLMRRADSYVWTHEVPQAFDQAYTKTTWVLGDACSWKDFVDPPGLLDERTPDPRFELMKCDGDTREPTLLALHESGESSFSERAVSIHESISTALGRSSIPDHCFMTRREMEILAEELSVASVPTPSGDPSPAVVLATEATEGPDIQVLLAPRQTVEPLPGAVLGAVRLHSGGSRLFGVDRDELWCLDPSSGADHSIRVSHEAAGGVLSAQGRHLVMFGGPDASLFSTLRGELRRESSLDGEIEGPIVAAWESGPNLWLRYQGADGSRDGCVPLRPGPGGRRRFEVSDTASIAGLLADGARFGESVVGRDAEGRLVGAETLRSAGVPEGMWLSTDACVVQDGWLWVGLMAGGAELWLVLRRHDGSFRCWSSHVATPGGQAFLERSAGLSGPIPSIGGVPPVARLWLADDGRADLYDVLGPDEGTS